ncbi:hypothetical protein FOZ63_018472 [Perkinsus olseni]|uniref:Uncharacterized protein n=1 Tax=Perkinsus olseni TaxID=32597 RepID=A0A7J6TC60_PEROL|nr:hypothetical protein FOZ63_018472 [Perkinsus olseni]
MGDEMGISTLEHVLAGEGREESKGAALPAVGRMSGTSELTPRGPGALAEMPTASSEVMNPVTRQRARRRVRTQALIQRYVAQLLLCGSEEEKRELLDGIDIQIEGVDSESPRSPHTIYYSLSPLEEHNVEGILRRMETLAPLLQRRIADKLTIGLCPPLV